MYAVGESNDSPTAAASRAGYVTVEIRGDGSVLARRPDGVYVDVQITGSGPFASETRSPTVLAAESAWQRGDHPAAIELYRAGAEHGDVQAMVALGLLYAHGRHIEKDGREAARWFVEAAKLGYADGQYRLGWLYARGNGLPKDLDQAEQLLRQAARQNHAAAAYELGSLLLASSADAQHMTEAVAWISKAAEAAHIKAQLQLAQLYSAGRGVPQDAALAEHWRNKAVFNELLRAARKGDVEDELELARAYAAGKLTAADPQNAEWWYQRVIEKSGGLYRSIIAYEELGEFFQRHGDPEKTKHYYTLAAEAGSTTARDKLKAMETAQTLAQMSPLRRYRFHLAAKDWKGKIVALWSGTRILPAIFVVSLIGLPIASYLFDSQALSVLALLGIGVSGLPLAVMLLVTAYWLGVAALAHARAWHAIVALAAVIVATAVLISGNNLLPPNSAPEPGMPQQSGTPPGQDEQEQRIQEAQECLQEAKQLVRHTPGESQEERERKDLEADWIQYLRGIQARGDYANWSDKPCDLYLRNHTYNANDAVAGGFATITAIGNDGPNGLTSVNVSITLTNNAGTTIILPAGTQFTIDSSTGTQNMISARQVPFTFVQVSPPETASQASSLGDRRLVVQNRGGLRRALYRRGGHTMRRVMYMPPASPVSRSLVQDVPAYCINRWRDVPNSQSRFSVSDANRESPVGKLVSCLEDDPAPHEAKQAAVWMISDNLINLTPQQLEDKFVEERKSKFHPSAAELADMMQKADPTLSDTEIDKIRQMSPAELEEAWSELLPLVLPIMRKQAAQEVQTYKDVAGPLLQSCGFDLPDSAFFSQ